LRQNTPLVELAVQFGHATGKTKGVALRSAIDDPSPERMRNSTESHERGAILVAAVFDAFFRTYQERVQDLLRIATGGTGRLPDGDLHPDLVARIAREATSAAQATLRMCIRAFDYLPPVDITFGDYLRAMVTADFELNPVDEGGLRRNMVEAFRVRGIYPAGVNSLSEDSLRWTRFDGPVSLEKPFPDAVLSLLHQEFLEQAAATSRNSIFDVPPPAPAPAPEGGTDGDEHDDATDKTAKNKYYPLSQWAQGNRKTLFLSPDAPVAVEGVHVAYRVAQDGQPLLETVVQFVQTARKPDADLGGVAYRGGATVVLKANGAIQYVIAKPLKHDGLPPEQKDLARLRFERQLECLADYDAQDAFGLWQNPAYLKNRLLNRATLAAMHQGALR
jgi:hypothetical protein